MSRASLHDVPLLREVSEYTGQETVRIACTQLSPRYSATQARKVVSDWIDFFEAGPTPIRDLEFRSRTPKRLFASLGAQSQLQRLFVKWGDYEDLSAVSNCSDLRELTLHGASCVTNVEVVGRLTTFSAWTSRA